MFIDEKRDLLRALKKGVVTVTFQKVDSEEIRVMPCTLNPKFFNAHGLSPIIDNVDERSNQIPVWSLDKNAWRDFLAETVLGWEVLGE